MNNAMGLAEILVRFKVEVGATGIRNAFPTTVSAAAVTICRTVFRFQHDGIVSKNGKERKNGNNIGRRRSTIQNFCKM
jgi:hypothetical protein